MPGKRTVALILFLLSLTFYVATMCPSIYTMDCGELIIAAYRLRIAHATGYPLFCLLGKLFTLLVPIGTIAWRMNLLNALFGAAAVTVVFLALCEITKRRTAAALAATVLAVSPVFWDAATSADVHSFSALFMAVELWLFLRWRRMDDNRLLCYLALVGGLSATNHLTALMVFAGILYGVIKHDRSVLRNRPLLLKTMLLFALPLSLYVYLPLRAGASRGTVWGGIYAVTGFEAHVTGRVFKCLMFNSTPLQVAKHFLKFLYLMIQQFPLYIAWGLPLGVLLLRRKRDNELLSVLGIAILLNVFYSINYAIIDIETYYLPTMLALCFFIAAGVDWAFDNTKTADLRNAALAGICAALVIVTVVRLPSCSKHGKTFISDYACNVLKNLDRNSLFLACGDGGFNAILYEQMVNGKRPDVIVLQRQIVRGWSRSLGWTGKAYFEDIAQRSPALRKLLRQKVYTAREVHFEKLLNDVISASLKERPVYLGCGSGDVKSHPVLRYFGNYKVVPEGVTYRIYPKSTKLHLARVIERSENVWKTYQLRGIYRDRSGCSDLELEIPDYYAIAHVTLADLELRARMYDSAVEHYRKAIVIDDTLIRAHNGLGIAYACQGKYHLAADQWNKVLERHPNDKVALRSIRATFRSTRQDGQ